MTDNHSFYLIIEAKLGWRLPMEPQLRLYSEREDFNKSTAQNKAIVSMSECTEVYADCYFPFKEINGTPIKRLSWQRIYDIALEAKRNSRNAEKILLEELRNYLGGIMTMQSRCQRRNFFDLKRRPEMTHIAGHTSAGHPTAGISAGGTV